MAVEVPGEELVCRPKGVGEPTTFDFLENNVGRLWEAGASLFLSDEPKLTKEKNDLNLGKQ